MKTFATLQAALTPRVRTNDSWRHHSNQAFANSQHSTGTLPNEFQHHSAGVHNIGIYGMSSKASIFQGVSKIIKLNQHSIGNYAQVADLLILVQEQIKVSHTVYSLSTKSHREEWRNIGRFQKYCLQRSSITRKNMKWSAVDVPNLNGQHYLGILMASKNPRRGGEGEFLG